MRVYISGPITNNPYAFAEFSLAETQLKKEGHEVINPAALSGVIQFEAAHEEYMRICLPLLDLADAIYMIGGWRASTGACIEHGYALAQDKIIIQGNADKQEDRERNIDKMKSGWIINLKSGARIMLDEKAYEKYRNEPPKEEVKSEEHWFDIDNMCKANLNLDLMEL